MQWCVVFFHFDKTIEVVPEHWVFDDDNTICHFPPVKGFRLYEIIKSGTSPKEDWKVYDVNMLAKYDDFTYAQTQCEAARNGKKIFSQKTKTMLDGMDGKGQRIRKPNTKFSEFMNINTDDEELNTNITFPTFKGSNPKECKQNTADNNKVTECPRGFLYRK
uniref:Uncharacterized protein n=1 Tax=Photinus pyralis TaxID=7054 RepID=A0A1Y1LJ68_PHOPY